MCAVFGDPHYRTFDGLIYNYQGMCQYILAEDCHSNNFSIKVRNSARMTNQFAWTKTVGIRLGDYRVSLQQKLKVKVGGQRVQLPYEQHNVFTVIQGGHTVTLKTNLGFKVIWDGNSYLELSVTPSYRNKMCGLCGNFNGRESDDMVGRDGVQYHSANEFGDTWKIGRTLTGCTRDSELPVESPCKRSRKRQLRAEAECSAFQLSAFSECRQVVNVTLYLR